MKSSSKPYRRRLACLASCTMLLSLCSLLPQAQAGGSWLVDGRTVQALDVKTSNADPNAFYTDGSRPMTSKLVFDSSVSSLFRAYVPWDGMYDFFIMDPTNEAVHLCNGTSGFYPTEDLDIFGNILGDTHGSGSVDIGETTLKGGTWMVDAVGPYDQCIVSKGYADSRYVQKAAVTSPLVFDPSLSSETTGLFKATVPWDAQYDFFAFDPQYEAIKLSPTIAELGFEAGDLVMHGHGTIRYLGENTYISFEERMLAGGGWFVSTVENDPNAILNRSYADNRYVMKSTGITTNYTVQAGDVLQIQNGVITAINP